MSTKNYIIIITAFLSMSIFSCKHHGEEYHSITDKIEAESKNYHGISISSEEHLGDEKMIEVTVGERTFLIPERKSKIKSFACTECHSKPLSELQSSEEIKKAHWDITINHADQNTMNCTTCHNEKKMDDLTSLTGNTIDLNKSYQLCAQCHTKQYDDWQGGAHGKRIGGWAPPRASMTCVNCHNPHEPHFESKWPARFNTQKIKERK